MAALAVHEFSEPWSSISEHHKLKSMKSGRIAKPTKLFFALSASFGVFVIIFSRFF
jgi:hypothetical protein